jgi:hypothetical protein
MKCHKVEAGVKSNSAIDKIGTPGQSGKPLDQGQQRQRVAVALFPRLFAGCPQSCWSM